MKYFINNSIHKTGDTITLNGVKYINCTDTWFRKHGAIEVVEIEDEGISGLYCVDEDGNQGEAYTGQVITHEDKYTDEDGKVKVYEWTEPVPHKYFEYVGKPQGRTIEEARMQKIGEIEAYDTSDAVNGFEYQGQNLWIDKATRVGLVNAVDSAILLEKENITFGISGISVTLPCATAKAMLAQLELYALECYNVTLAHKNTIEELDSIESVDAFDVTIGYPEKLAF